MPGNARPRHANPAQRDRLSAIASDAAGSSPGNGQSPQRHRGWGSRSAPPEQCRWMYPGCKSPGLLITPSSICQGSLEAAQILRRRRVRRPADKGRKGPDVANVIVARLLAEPANDHVLTGRWEGWEVIGAPLELKVAGPSMFGIGCPDRHALPFNLSTPLPKTGGPRRAESRESGFVRCPERDLPVLRE